VFTNFWEAKAQMARTGQITHRASFAGQIQEHVLKNGLGSGNHSAVESASHRLRMLDSITSAPGTEARDTAKWIFVEI
jgi:hypothetical protein